MFEQQRRERLVTARRRAIADGLEPERQRVAAESCETLTEPGIGFERERTSGLAQIEQMRAAVRRRRAGSTRGGSTGGGHAVRGLIRECLGARNRNTG